MNIKVCKKMIFGMSLSLAMAAAAFAKSDKPNFVIVFTDDQGYADLGCFGAEGFETPNIDRLGSDGLVARSFYVSSSVCTPSRAALQTGKYHANVDLWGGVKKRQAVYFPNSPRGMSPKEVTIAEVLKPVGYSTGLFGKWHLGFQKEYLPTSQGYDYFYGTPYSNDMSLAKGMAFAKDVNLRDDIEIADLPQIDQKPKLLKKGVPILRGTEVVEYPAQQETLTLRYFNEAMAFIDKSAKADKPFYVCITPNMPHVPLHASKDFAGKTKRGIYGDAVAEIDFNVGCLVKYLKDNGLYENTFIIFTSDNGPWLKKGDKGGTAKPLKNGKGTLFEGGVRVPCVMAYGGKIISGDSWEMMSSIDLLPTFAALAGAKAPEGIDGLDLSAYLLGKSKNSPRDTFLYYNPAEELCDIRVGDWKILMKRHIFGYSQSLELEKYSPKNEYPLELFNLKDDISETTDLSKTNPKKFEELKAIYNSLSKKN